ncbi:alpha/beta hydrolase [Chitinophaga alhagiae]|uniref:alpha/beta hydrolase n=1 Tax=Chitinophaga alhagiae TaxID=2203219 RepID=UPI0013004D36|nr:alpha/beta hydrolase [Chitinophaga alhagiae]
MKQFCISIALSVIFAVGGYAQNTHRLPLPAAKLKEELVYAISPDTVFNAGVLFHADKIAGKETAIIWVHGWSANFYSPGYIMIGRALAERGFISISVNTRMHDLANVQGYKHNRRIRGGGYWGIAADEVKDIAGWIDFAELKGFKHVILVGHSAGWAAVRRYQSEKQDARVIGLVCASGQVSPDTRPIDSSQYIPASRYISGNKPDKLIEDPKRSFPSYISAATYMDIVNTPPEQKDFFGWANPGQAGITKVQCPILVFYATNNDVGNETELKSLQAHIEQHFTNVRLTTAMIKNTDHMYMGASEQVADTLVNWIEGILNRK